MVKCTNLIAKRNGKNVFCGEYLMGKKRYCHKCQISKLKVVILDDNELSLALYAEEYPENWKKICDSLSKQSTQEKNGK